jgi:hypothetical protein
MLFAPLEGWRHVEVTERRTAVDYVRIPAHVGHPFRRIPATCSDGCRPPFPIEAGHP